MGKIIAINCSPRSIWNTATLVKEAAYPMLGYKKKLKDYKNTLDAFVGETEVFVSGNTLQVSDYSIYDWTMFDPKAKQKRREKVFPKECKKAFERGAELFG